MKPTIVSALAVITALSAQSAYAETLRLLTWGGYAPEEVIALFEAETGHSVEVTTSNNEEMIAKLRATNGGGFDLAQPSQDRITSAQEEFEIYKPIDMSKVEADLCGLRPACGLGHQRPCREHSPSGRRDRLYGPVRSLGCW